MTPETPQGGKERPPIPKPTAFDEGEPKEIPEAFRPPPPGPLKVIPLARDGRDELVVVYKRTYRFQDGRPPWLADEQRPLDPQGTPHKPLDPERLPSYRSLPELLGYKTGTDLVIQGSARPPRPMDRMSVSARVGQIEHRADVMGARYVDYVSGKIAFTPPEPFEVMPLRYENAYGGRDGPFEEWLAGEVERTTPEEDLRRARPSFEGAFQDNHPLAYPRNRFGKGYVIEERMELVQGRELPNLERPDDRLTPERLVVGNPMDWGRQPVPVGFDYLEPSAFPRTALLGIPPGSRIPWAEMPEIGLGLVPADYSRGTILECEPAEIPNVIHPHGSRCASLGLWLPFLTGREVVLLQGMDPRSPLLRVSLPGELPVFSGRWPGSLGQELAGTLLLAEVDVDGRILTLIWSARAGLDRPLGVQELPEVENDLNIRMMEA